MSGGGRDKIAAVDLGASSGRVFVATFVDGGLSFEEVARFANRPVRVGQDLCWNVLGLLDGVWSALEKITAADVERLASLGFDTWAVDFGLLDRSGRLIDNVFHYRDQRTRDSLERISAMMPRIDLYRLTGAQFARFNTLSQLVALRAARPWVLDTAETLVMVGELFTYLLTGVKVSEWTNATTTQLCGLATRTWAEPIFRAFDLPLRIMPRVVPPGTAIGTPAGDWARGTGWERVPLCVPGVHDTASAVAAVPYAAAEDRPIYVSSGTWSLIGTLASEPIVSGEALQLNFANEGAVGGGFRFLRNVQGMWLLEQCLACWRRSGPPSAWDELLAAARGVPGLRSLFDPDMALLYEGGDVPAAIASFCAATGQEVPATRGEIVRAILESLALKYRWVIEALQGLAGAKGRTIHIVGGGARNALLNQMVADATGLPVEAGPYEATAIGNALVQAVAAGLIRDLHEGRALVRASLPVRRFEPGSRAAWDEAYGRFQRLTRLP